MEILFIGTLEPHPGGSGVVNAQVMRGLARRGHRIHAVAPLGPLSRSANFAPIDADDQARFPGFAVHRYRVPYAEVEPQRTDEDFIDIERAALSEALRGMDPPVPDVVFLGRESFARYAPDVLPWSARPPHVVVAHSTIADGAFGAGTRMPLANELRRRLAACQRVVLVAEHQRQEYETLGTVLEVVPNGVELDRFAPALRAPGDGETADDSDIVVFHASNMKPPKRPLDLVSAAARALLVQPRLRFVIAGDGPLLGAVRDSVREHGIEQRFEFTGWVERTSMPDLYRRADMVVLMSEREAMPCILIEGMASALTVISTDLPASRELLIDGESGYLYPIGDVDALARRMTELAADAGLRARTGAAARAVAEHRDLEHTIDGYERLLAATAAGGRGGSPDAARISRA